MCLLNICMFLKAFQKMTFYHCTHSRVFRCSATIPGCSAVLPVFRVMLFRWSWFYSMPLSNGLTKLRFKYNNIGPGCNTNMSPFSESHTSGAWNTNCQMNSRHSSIIWPVLLNSWVFVYELSGCGFHSTCSHLNSRFHACFEQGVPWHWDNYRVWIHSERRTRHDKNIQSNAPYR